MTVWNLLLQNCKNIAKTLARIMWQKETDLEYCFASKQTFASKVELPSLFKKIGLIDRPTI